MADISRLKPGRKTLGTPPAESEASPNLSAPETAPITLAREVEPPKPQRIDGRSLRRTHRTVQLATKVSPEYDAKLRMIAQRDSILICELLEKALDAYEESRK